jgi:hypothetical protein
MYLFEIYKSKGLQEVEEFLLEYFSMNTPSFKPLPRKRTMSFGELS